MTLFPSETQSPLVVVLMDIHNFIRDATITDQEFRYYDENEDYFNNDEDTTRLLDLVATNFAK